MKKIVLTVIVSIFGVSVFSQDFRKATWGMSPSQVKAVETNEILEETSDYVAFNTTLANFEAFAVYYFVKNKLTRGRYVLTETHSNKNDYISDYNTINEFLKKKYQEPAINEIFWKNDLYKDDYSEWGFAISLGHLLYYATYKNPTTEINIILSGENYKINHIIEYKSIVLEEIEEELRAEEDLSNFSLFGFRNNVWGDSLSFVKSKEEFNLVQAESDLLVYEGRVAGMDMLLGYIFTQNKLTTGKYILLEDHSNTNDYISDYERLKDLLIQKYGEPIEDEEYWKNDLYQDDYSQWGFAISLGHLIYYSTFENEMSEITLMLSGENYEINLQIEAKSIALKALEDNAKEKKLLNDF